MKKLIILLLLYTMPSGMAFSGEVNHKIGPLLHERIAPSHPEQETMDFHQFDPSEQTSEQSSEPSGEEPASEDIMKIIVVMDRHHLSDLPQALVDELETRVTRLGGYIGNHAFNRVQVFLPAEKTKELAGWEEIKLIKLPTPPEPLGGSVQSEGLPVGKVNNWHDNGITGNGVRTGVLDLGFSGYYNLVGSELPENTTAVYTGTNSDFYSTVHGTACAEILHDVAPGADLYLVNVADMDVDYPSAVSWLEQQRVDIISSSMALNLRNYCYYIYNVLHSSYYSQLYAQTQLSELSKIEESINYTVNQTVSKSTAWIQAAGNSAQARWNGFFFDPDKDGWHNYLGEDERNEITFLEYGEPIYIVLAWETENDFLSRDDYDLFVYNETTGKVVASSEQDQLETGLGLEACRVTPFAGYRYSIAVKKYAGGSQNLTVMIGYKNIANLEYNSPAETIKTGAPNGNKNVISVGAVPWYNPYAIEDFSSQGPAEGGLIKPDLVAPDGVSTVSYDHPFYGTSAAAPYVAGISALILQRYPSYSPLELKNYLESNAIDLGAPGKDNVYGSGLVQLPIIINNNPAPGVTQTQVSQLYVAIFGRASEGSGNIHWQAQPDMITAADAMLDTQAAIDYFGENLNQNQAFIAHIYRNTLDKTITDDHDGVTFWTALLNTGITRGEAVASIVEAIQDYAPGGPHYDPDDTATNAAYQQFANRVEVSNYMADTVYDLPDAWETKTRFGQNGLMITDSRSTVTTARNLIDDMTASSY